MALFENLEEHLKEHPWVLFMTWRDLLFASWRIPIEAIRPLVPAELELDTFDGSAWVTLVPMEVTDMHWRGIQPIPGMEGFRELNLRTYVKRKERGVYFLSIDCPAAFSDWIARQGFGAPYYEAQTTKSNADGLYHFASERTQKGKPPAVLFSSFKPVGDAVAPSQGSLESFLLERYCLYFVRGGSVYRGDIRHQEWLIQQAEADLDVNTIAHGAGLSLGPKPDHLGFVLRTDTLVCPPVKEK